MSEGRLRTTFTQMWYQSMLGEWATDSCTLDEWSMMRVADLVGKTVNIGDKDGGVWDGVTVTAFDEARGFLTLEGGRYGSSLRSAEPLEGLVSLSAHDVARGYIHE